MEEKARTPGFILSWRSVFEKGFYKEPDYAHLWNHLILKANHKTKTIIWNGKEMEIKRGQFITGRKILAEETGVQESKVERILKFFESEQQIEQQKTNRYRLISITNYGKHQDYAQQNEQQVNNKRTQLKNEDNDNNDKKEEKKKSVRSDKAPSGPPKITFNWTLLEFENITPDHHKVWKKAYPAVDIPIELNKYITWLVANKKKAKTHYMRSLNYWFSQVQDRGGTRGSPRTTGIDGKVTWIDDYEKKQKEKQ